MDIRTLRSLEYRYLRDSGLESARRIVFLRRAAGLHVPKENERRPGYAQA